MSYQTRMHTDYVFMRVTREDLTHAGAAVLVARAQVMHSIKSLLSERSPGVYTHSLVAGP